jgi:hypothetical protein
MKNGPELWRRLRVGDRIRLVKLDFLNWHTLHIETKQAYKYLLKRRRPLTVYTVDSDGLPWIQFRFRGSRGRLRHDFLAVNHGGLAIVKSRKKPDSPQPSAIHKLGHYPPAESLDFSVRAKVESWRLRSNHIGAAKRGYHDASV